MAETSTTLSSPEVEDQAIWGGVTDPTQHDPKHFRYLLHIDSGHRLVPFDPNDPHNDDLWEYALDDPDKLRSLDYISASLVDENHPVLYQFTSSSHGFILESPKSSIIAATSRDMFARSKSKSAEGLRNEFGVPDPEQLLNETRINEWNEVVVSPDGMVIKALFWTDTKADDEAPFEKEAVKSAAEKLRLPFLELDLVKF